MLDCAERPLYIQRRKAGAESVIFQRGRGAEDRHDAVTGELVDGAAIAMHDCGGAVQQVGHDLAQAFGADR